MGVGYFSALAGNFLAADEHAKLTLLAEVERRVVDVLRPLVKKHGGEPRDDAVLLAIGERDAKPHLDLGWAELMASIVAGYPAYVEAFEALERMAPEGDRPALRLLTLHEVATVAFATKEIAGEGDSLAPIEDFLGRRIG